MIWDNLEVAYFLGHPACSVDTITVQNTRLAQFLQCVSLRSASWTKGFTMTCVVYRTFAISWAANQLLTCSYSRLLTKFFTSLMAL